jgi:hypothetical protein
MMDQYIVLCGQVVGGADRPVTIEYGFDGEMFADRREAITHGFDIRGSDDFNIGVLRGGKLVSLDWMDDPVDTDANLLAEIQARVLVP